MSSEPVRNLSILDLLRALNEKLGLECIMLQKSPLCPTMSSVALEAEVSKF